MFVTPGSSEGSAQSKSHNKPSISGSALIRRTPSQPVHAAESQREERKAYKAGEERGGLRDPKGRAGK